MEDLDFLQFIHKVNQHTKIDLSQYKEAQMKRRLITLRNKKGYDTFAAFYDAMTQDAVILHEFLDRMTINVSEFWRNPARWQLLQEVHIPELLAKKSSLKCWSAACSTGEEPYTLAMILQEQGVLQQSMILATDIDDIVLDKAKTGVYHERSLREISPAYMKKYFTQEEAGYRISEVLKRSIRFQKHNLLLDRFDSQFDLIICRNVLIYFTEEAKQKLYQRFAQALRPGGILFVGSTEQIFHPEQFELESTQSFFYRKKG
ncbi:MAG: chemotaxis protein CheR [Paenibacillus sp. RIFOXYA1_FULL_44_5]|nr:MAG: chemotaxis protein CheR [Paenibacillus sp. RIFOXYA1_FULL_44_5]